LLHGQGQSTGGGCNRILHWFEKSEGTANIVNHHAETEADTLHKNATKGVNGVQKHTAYWLQAPDLYALQPLENKNRLHEN
jgi:hypothetical protein